MIYKFDKENLTYKKVTGKLGLIILATIIISTFFFTMIANRNINDVKYISEETKAIILNQRDEFTQEKLKEYVLQLNIKYPHIVLAQAELETGGFTSGIFKENNNLFGMREARQRCTTASGTDNNHAFYDTWKSSVVDYALYQSAFLRNIKTEDEYFEYLRQNYAEDPQYVAKIKRIIDRNHLV
jgi:uncharacterized FlgJ-related protein